jgi:hypothetical protein
MAMIENDPACQFQHHNSFDIPNYHYNDRRTRIPLSYEASSSPGPYPIGRPAKSRAGTEKYKLSSLTTENRPARSRIGIAVGSPLPNAQSHYALIWLEFRILLTGI